MPVVFASPHSGTDYRPEDVALSRLDLVSLRRSEDAFVDELFAAAPFLGAPLLRSLYPRVFLDANREPFELDPAMFADILPSHVNTTSPRVAGGLGTVARVVASGEPIYGRRLPFAEAERRIGAYYEPYHRTLAELIDQTRALFGGCLLIDCHSMPSVGGPMDRDPGLQRVDFVLGDCHGTSCAALIPAEAEKFLVERGFVVTRNNPYAGGFTTQHYGRPREGCQVLQIEINRRLYMDEKRIEHLECFPAIKGHIEALIGFLGEIARRAIGVSP